MKNILMLAMLITLVSCSDPSISQKTPGVDLPEGLQDCKFYLLSDPSNNFGNAKIVRCPNSVTTATYLSGKTLNATVTLVGVPYAPVEKPDLDTIEFQGEKYARVAKKGN